MNNSTLKLSELINNDKTFNFEEFMNKIQIEIYIPIFTKEIAILGYDSFSNEDSNRINGIVDFCCVQDDDGYFVVNSFNKEIAYSMAILKHYTNLEIDIDSVEINEKEVNIYDYLRSNYVFEYVKSRIPNEEISLFNKLLKESIQNKLNSENSVEANVIRIRNRVFELGDKIIDKLPDEKGIKRIINEVKNAVNKIKPEQLDNLKNIINGINTLNK